MAASGVIGDLRFALRQLAARPGFTAVAVLTLALGIGANTAVFSALSGYLLTPLPYPHAAQLARVYTTFTNQPGDQEGISLPLYRVIKDKTSAFSQTAVFASGTATVKVGGGSRTVPEAYASASLFRMLGAQPLLGRAFTRADMRPGNGQVVIISNRLWHSRFDADPGVIGKTLQLDDGPHRIVGVMPPGFAFPNVTTALWIPLMVGPNAYSPAHFGALSLTFIGRRASGVSLGEAGNQVQHAVALYMRAKLPASLQAEGRKIGFAMAIQSWRSHLAGNRASIWLLLQGAVILVLLITCVNVANLLLARILGRTHEMAMRSTLGATRTALARQLLAEALCLSVPAGLAGVGFAWLALQFLDKSSLATGSSVFRIALDWRVGLFALAAVLFTSALVTVLPIRHLAKTNLQAALQDGGRTSSAGRGSRRTRQALVVGELTLVTALLVVSGLLLHSFLNMEAVDPGFRRDNVLIARILIPMTDHSGGKDLTQFKQTLRKRVDELPGIRQAAMTSYLPLSGARSGNPPAINTFFFVGGGPRAAKKAPGVINLAVSPGYFKALGIPVLRGRGFNVGDAKAKQPGYGPPVIIDAALAKTYYPDQNPIGQQVRLGLKTSSKRTIVGVVASVRYSSLTHAPIPTLYADSDPISRRTPLLVIHTAVPPAAVIRPLRKLVSNLDPNVALYDVRTMREQVSGALLDRKTIMNLLLAFGGIALALALVGIYAVMRYAVSERRNELGIRLALGAVPGDLSRLVVTDALRLLAVSLVIGLGLAVLAGYLLSAHLFGVTPFDPLVLGGTVAVLGGTTLLACYLPARRAARLNPTEVIHEQ